MNWRIAGLSAFFLVLGICLIPSIALAGACVDAACTIDCIGGTCNGTEGDDWICGTKGDDTINGLGGNDRICDGFGNDTINGGDGGDIIQGGWGQDTLNGDAGADTIRAGQCDDTIDGGADTEIECEGGLGLDSITGCDGIEDFGQEGTQVHPNCGNAT